MLKRREGQAELVPHDTIPGDRLTSRESKNEDLDSTSECEEQHTQTER